MAFLTVYFSLNLIYVKERLETLSVVSLHITVFFSFPVEKRLLHLMKSLILYVEVNLKHMLSDFLRLTV